MAIKNTMPLIEEIFKYYVCVKDGDFMRDLIALILKKLMEAEVTAKIGIDKYERTEEKTIKCQNTDSTAPSK